MAVLGLQSWSSFHKWGLLSSCRVQASHCGGFSCCRARALGMWVSVVELKGLVAPCHVGPSWTRDQTCILYIGRPVLNHWTTREALSCSIIDSSIYTNNLYPSPVESQFPSQGLVLEQDWVPKLTDQRGEPARDTNRGGLGWALCLPHAFLNNLGGPGFSIGPGLSWKFKKTEWQGIGVLSPNLCSLGALSSEPGTYETAQPLPCSPCDPGPVRAISSQPACWSLRISFPFKVDLEVAFQPNSFGKNVGGWENHISIGLQNYCGWWLQPWN